MRGPGGPGRGRGRRHRRGSGAYACALADHVRTEHGPVESWEGREHVWQEVVAVGELLGGSSPRPDEPAHPGLSEPAREIRQGVNRLDLEMLQTGLDEVVRACEER